MAVQTPEYWQKERYQPLIEETTAYGNKVLIPKSFQGGWEMERLRMEWSQERGLEMMAGLESKRETHPLYYDMARVFYEVYPKEL